MVLTWPSVTFSRERLSCWRLYTVPNTTDRGVTEPSPSQYTCSYLHSVYLM